MAAGRHPSRLFVVAQDSSLLGNFVFNLNLKHLFSEKDKSQVPDDEEPPLLRSMPDPVVFFKQVDLTYEYMAFAASPDGRVIAAVGYNGQTLLYDAGAAAVSPGPDMHSNLKYPVLLPVGDRTFLAISAYPRTYPHEGQGRRPPTFEVLQQVSRTGRWAWTAVPDPPGTGRVREDLGAYLVFGARVYVSLREQGTYSYHTLRRRWRTEGAWELPVRGRAILVPNFLGTGRRLLFGFRDLYQAGANEEYPLCAVDMDARPPVVVGCWPRAARFSQEVRAGYGMCSRVSELNYFGGGRFCISVTSHSRERSGDGVVVFMAVEFTKDLQLLKRQYSCYVLPQSARRFPADVLLSS